LGLLDDRGHGLTFGELRLALKYRLALSSIATDYMRSTGSTVRKGKGPPIAVRRAHRGFVIEEAYFADMLDAIEAMTIEAIRNCASRFVHAKAMGDPGEVGIDGPDSPTLILPHEEAYRPIKPGIGIRGPELGAERRVAEDEQRRWPQFDAGIASELGLIDLGEDLDALGLDVLLDAHDRVLHRVGAAHSRKPGFGIGAGRETGRCRMAASNKRQGQTDFGGSCEHLIPRLYRSLEMGEQAGRG
jgi:hypothetical protein